MTVLVVFGAVAAAVGLCALWDWALNRIVARQMRGEEERLRRQRATESPVLGGVSRHLRTRDGSS